MGKVITAQPDVNTEIVTPRGKLKYEETFYEFLADAMGVKGPIADLEQIERSIATKAKIMAAHEAKAPTLTLEDAEFTAMANAVKSYAATMLPDAAMACVAFLRALKPDAVQTVDLAMATKK